MHSSNVSIHKRFLDFNIRLQVLKKCNLRTFSTFLGIFKKVSDMFDFNKGLCTL